MAVRRKYVSAAVADAPIEPDVPVATQAAPPERPATPMPRPEPRAGNPLQHALEGHQRAEEIQRQRQAQPQGGIEEYVDRLPDLSPHKRAFLKQYPALLHPEVAPIMSRVYREALEQVRDDTPEMDQYILENVSREIDQRELTSADTRSTRENAQAHHEANVGAEELGDEADALMAEFAAAHQPPPPATPRRSIPFSAPVSREAPMASGGRASDGNTLSAEERQIARSSFSAPNMTNAQKEFQYLQNRKRMLEMKKTGAIQGDR